MKQLPHISLLLLLVMGQAVRAQPCYLLQYNGSEAGLIARDTVEAVNGQVVFNGEFQPGVYELKVGEHWQHAFVVSKGYTSLQLPVVTDAAHVPKSATDVLDDAANRAFVAMNKAITAWNAQEQSFQQRLMNEAALLMDVAAKREKEREIHGLFTAAFAAHQAEMQTIAAQYPDTYTARVLVPYYTRPVQDRWIMNPPVETWPLASTYFEDWDFAEEGFQNNPLIRQRIMEFIRLYHNVGVPEGHIAAIDEIMQHASANEAAKTWTMEYLLDVYLKMGPEAAVHHIYNNHIESCGETGIATHKIKRVLQLKNLKPGVPAPQFTMVNHDGAEYASTAAGKDGKATLYIFWSSGCSHCQQEMPRLPELQRELGSDIQIVTISTDKAVADWDSFLDTRELRLPGILHLCDGLGLDSPAAQAWFVFGTPAMFYVDAAGNFRGQFQTIDTVKQYFKKI